MRVVFINNAGDHEYRVNEQVKKMNSIVINMAVGQIQSGVSQYMGYPRYGPWIGTNWCTNEYVDVGNKIGKNERWDCLKPA